jgi:hypothetical protein
MKLFLFALFLLPGLAQATPITFAVIDTSDQLTLQSTSPAPSVLYLIDALGNPIALVNLRDYDGQALNTSNLPLWLGDEFLITGQLTTSVSAIPEPPAWLMLGAGFIGLAIATRHRRK